MANPQGQVPAHLSQQAQSMALRQGAQIVHTSHTQQVQYVGPTPPPEHVEAYERMLPGAAGRFLTLAEGEAAHRRNLENEQFAARKLHAIDTRALASRGQIFAFIIAMSGIGAGLWLGAHDAQITGGIIGGGGLVTIILAFLRGGPRQKPPAEGK